MALTLLTSACGGGDDPSAADQAVIDAIAAQIGADGDAPAGLDLNCMASAMVDGLGGTQVMADSYGLTAETIAAGQEPDTVVLSVEDARTMGDASMDCGMGSIILAQLAGDGTSLVYLVRWSCFSVLFVYKGFEPGSNPAGRRRYFVGLPGSLVVLKRVVRL